MLLKEYRICMPISVDEYRLGQLYMIAKHSHEQSENGQGVEVVRNEECTDPVHGSGRYTEKRVHLSSRLPSWIRSLIPRVFYITEKAWNYFPYTITEYTCSFVPRFSIHIETRYEDNAGTTENCVNLTPEELDQREVDFLDIAYDEVPAKHYKESEDLTKFKSEKTARGPLERGWRGVLEAMISIQSAVIVTTQKTAGLRQDTSVPLMCSYKVVKVKFEVFGLQGRVESFTQKSVRDILLLGHRQAFAWIDEWIDLTMEDIRQYESSTFEATNKKVLQAE